MSELDNDFLFNFFMILWNSLVLSMLLYFARWTLKIIFGSFQR